MSAEAVAREGHAPAEPFGIDLAARVAGGGSRDDHEGQQMFLARMRLPRAGRLAPSGKTGVALHFGTLDGSRKPGIERGGGRLAGGRTRIPLIVVGHAGSDDKDAFVPQGREGAADIQMTLRRQTRLEGKLYDRYASVRINK